MSLLTGVYSHVGHHIPHKEEKHRRGNTALGCDSKEDESLIYCPLYVKYLKEYKQKVDARNHH